MVDWLIVRFSFELLLGAGIGFLFSIPVGPVNLGLISTTLKRGLSYGIMVGLGGAIMDGLYMFLGLLGVSLISIDGNWVHALKFAGVAILSTLGIIELRATEDKFRQDPELLKSRPLRRGYLLKGMLFYVSNPGVLASFTALAAWLKSRGLVANSGFTISHVFSALGVTLGSLCWFLLLGRIIIHYRERFSERLLMKISHVSGAALVLFALFLCWEVFRDFMG